MSTTLYISKGFRNSFVIVTLNFDIILVSNDFTLLKETKNNLLKKFEKIDLGEIQCFLGIQVNCVQQDLTQFKYIKGILNHFGIIENTIMQNPNTNCKPSKDMGLYNNDIDLEAMWVIPFQNVIRSFNYVMKCTRPHIIQVMKVVK
jgi:hypothetical protein